MKHAKILLDGWKMGEGLIRVLAVRQPWASLIIEGLKTIEVRSRPTNIRERVAIYVSKKHPTKSEIDWTYFSQGAGKVIENMNLDEYKRFNNAFGALCLGYEGHVIGTVEITTIETRGYDDLAHLNRRREHFAPFAKGDWYWYLKNPVKFELPIPYTPPKGAVTWSKTELPEGYQ